MSSKRDDRQEFSSPTSSRRVGLADVARLAGVGISTVDRVLNERGNVSPKTAQKVVDAARSLGIKRTLPLLHRSGLRFDVILVRPDAPFFARLSKAFVTIAQTCGHSINVQRTFISDFKPDEVAAHIRHSQAQGLVLFCQQHPAIVEAVNEATARGVAVVTIGSDLEGTGRFAYVGIDNFQAGRTAAHLLTQYKRGRLRILTLTHRLSYRAHAQREAGFRAGLAEFYPEAQVVGCIRGANDAELVSGFLDFAGSNEFDAIYSMTSINELSAVTFRKWVNARDTRMVGHEVSDHTADLLRSGYLDFIIDQCPEQQAYRAIEKMLVQHSWLEESTISADVVFTLHTRENLSVPFTSIEERLRL